MASLSVSGNPTEIGGNNSLPESDVAPGTGTEHVCETATESVTSNPTLHPESDAAVPENTSSKDNNNYNNDNDNADDNNNNNNGDDDDDNSNNNNNQKKKWPGWPGHNVFRVIVPVVKVGGIIGRKGDLIKKMCEDTRARIRILDGPVGTSDRIVLISAKEEPDVEISPAMAAVLRVFKRVNGISDEDNDNNSSVSAGMCSVRLLVASSQAINIIGKQGSLIKSIQEATGTSLRVLTGDELPFYVNPDERILEIQGETLKVLKALEASIGHLRKFLVDYSVIPLFEKPHTATISKDNVMETWGGKPQSFIPSSQSAVGNEHLFSLKNDSFFVDRETLLDPSIQRSRVALYGQDSANDGLRSTGLGRSTPALVTQVTQTMQVPLSYAEDIIGVGGANIAYIRRTSGATLTVQEGGGLPDEITVEIKGTSAQVQTAQLLVQDFIAGHRESYSSTYVKNDSGLRSYSQLGDSHLSSMSSLPTQSLSGYGSYKW